MSDEILLKHQFVVVAREHYNPLGIIRSLGQAGIKPIVIIIKEKLRFVGSSKYISKCIYVDEMEEAFDIIKHKYCNNEQKPFVFITDDYFLEYVDGRYNEIKDLVYITNAGEQGRISYFMNKDNINQLANECGIKIPKSEVVKTGELPKTLRYPIITKAISSTSGAWKRDSFVCKTEEELVEAFNKIQGKTMLLQEFIERADEFNIDGVSVNHGKSVFLSMITSYEYLIPGRYTTYLIVKNVIDDEISHKLKNMIRKMQYEGIFDGEFMIGKDGEVYFLEVNCRPNAFNYASTCAGMNDPVIWAKGMLEGRVGDSNYKEIPDGFRAMVEPIDFRDRVLGKRSSIFHWLFDFVRCPCHFYFNIRDIKPFIYYMKTK